VWGITARRAIYRTACEISHVAAQSACPVRRQQTNPARFHRSDGAGYRFLAEQIERLDTLNPQVAARVVAVFNDWRRYDEVRQTHMRGILERLRGRSNLSRDVSEIVAKSLTE